MNLWTRFKAGFKAASAGVTFPRTQSFFSWWSDVSQPEYAAKVGDGLDSNVVTSPIMWIARSFPEAPPAVRVDEDGKSEIDRGHPMARLLLRPNRFYSGDALWMATLLSLLRPGGGDAYWKKVSVNGKVAELWYLPDWLVTPVGTQTEYITHYEYRPSGSFLKYAPEEVIHFRYGLDPRDTRHGFSPLTSLVREIFSDDEAARMVAALLKNKGIPGILISPEKDVVIGDGDAEAMKAYIKEKTTGTHRGEPMVLLGATKVQTFGFSPAEMDLAAIRNIPEERVCAALGLPAAIAGFGTGLDTTKVGATMKELVKLAWTGCLLPLQRMLAADLTTQLLPDLEDNPRASAVFDASEVEALRQDAVLRAQELETLMRATIITRAEARLAIGRESTPADEVYLVPFNVTETMAGEMPEPEPPAALPAPGAKSFRAKARLTRIQARILRARDVSRKRFEARLKGRMLAFFARLGASAERAYLHISKDANDELRVTELFSEMSVPDFKKELRGIFGQHYVAVYTEQVAELSGLGIGINLPDAAQIEILNRGGTQAGLVDLTDAAKERALKIIADAREQGLGIPETARKLRDAIPAGPFDDVGYRATLIARTETRVAQTESAMMAYRSAEGISQVMIIDARLGPTDDECEAINGQVVSFDEGEALLADEHPNGTRDVVPIFQEVA